MKKTDISSLFEPRSIAVIGASRNRSKIGYNILNNIINSGFKGSIYPVNPSGGEILGQRVYKSIADIDNKIDVALIVVPAPLVYEAVQNCADHGVKFLQIITSGFSETGNTEEEKKITALARTAGMRILGPNTFGIYSSGGPVNCTFSATPIMPGNVAILTQSGALGIAMIGKTAVENLGLSAIVSLGNKCDIDESDLLEYLAVHEKTKVILLYMEGVKQGERLIKTLKNTTAHKPVIAIKSGRSKRGAMAAASHTGSLAGSDEIFDAIMRQCGVIRAESLKEAFNWCSFLASTPPPRGNRSVIVTNGGGIGVMATDACEEYGIALYDDQENLKKIFEPATPSFGSTKNPVDITGAAGSEDYRLALTAPAESGYLDATLALYCETATFDSENLVPMIEETFTAHLKAGKPVSYAVIGGADVNRAMKTLKTKKIPVFDDVHDAVSCLGASYRYRAWLAERSDEVVTAEIDSARINAVIDSALKDNRTFLLAREGTEVMEAAGICTPQSLIARTLDEAVRHSETLGYPLVMKIVSRDILHKSDAGGVALDLLSKEEVIDAYEAIMQNVRAYNPAAVIDGIELCRMVKSGTELIVGARMDASFGPIVMCGLGGIYVEVMKDVVFRGLPLNKKEVMSMLKEIRSFPLLLGVRGEKRKDIDAVIDTIIRVGTVIDKCRRITDIEINPIVVYEQHKGLIALDARILVKNPKEDHQ